jgi:hypothetical protein
MKKLNADALQNLTARLNDRGMLSAQNADRLVRVFYDATKIVYERQKRSKKPELKMKEISSALLIADRVNSNQFHFAATSGVLAECFGSMDEKKALDYYQKIVMGDVTDRLGRLITIDEDGMRSLYKDAETGKHIVSTENYEEVRGKRLPWIRHTLANSESVYISEETDDGKFRRRFLYTAVVSVPHTTVPQYYVVVVRQSKGKDGFKYTFLTAYMMLKRNRFLQIIEKCFF